MHLGRLVLGGPYDARTCQSTSMISASMSEYTGKHNQLTLGKHNQLTSCFPSQQGTDARQLRRWVKAHSVKACVWDHCQTQWMGTQTSETAQEMVQFSGGTFTPSIANMVVCRHLYSRFLNPRHDSSILKCLLVQTFQQGVLM